MGVLSAADRVYRARMMCQDSIQFASEFWELSDLLSYLAVFIKQISDTEVGVNGSGLELGLAIRRMVAEKCVTRWSMDGEAYFCRLSQTLHLLHTTLHAADGTITSEVRAAAILTLQEIEAVRALYSP
jgi:hypothetical protein